MCIIRLFGYIYCTANYYTIIFSSVNSFYSKKLRILYIFISQAFAA
ncbi:hypothetical protein RUMLAC_00496 [[Ruminococcus] lactaris ATCC 29176]|uniref:Uncharacterized protein n=1 Tax=[Ruminococcus] lactaris ATCC 29176 TaxID=471875 RepID=B5CM22_9FIRM|nr:hypothetical protein RUMLAC_00496 [[Ruminococcus] lactaris ATCC 29176]